MTHEPRDPAPNAIDGLAILETLDALRTGLAVFDRGDVLVWCNSQFRYIYRSLGSTQDILGLTFRQILEKLVDQSEIAGALAARDPAAWIEDRLVAHRRRWGVTLERLSDGRWIEIKERALPDGGIIGQWADVTERTRSQLRLEDAIESTADGFAIWSQAGRLALCNQRFSERHAGAKAGETFEEITRKLAESGSLVLKMPADEWVQGRMSDRRQPFLQTHLECEDGHHFILTERRTREGGVAAALTDVTDLKEKEIELTFRGQTLQRSNNELEMAKAILEQQGAELVALAEDLFIAQTEANRLRQQAEDQEAALRRAHDELEDRVRSRTRELSRQIAAKTRAETDLRAAKDQAEIASRAKTEFLANMSHELRTPLNAVIGFSDIMRSEMFGPLGSERYLEYAHSIHLSGDHLLRLINDILDISAIEAGMIDLNEAQVDLSDAIASCIKLVHWRAEAGRVTLETTLDRSTLPLLRADERRVKQILINLVSNAVKFTPEGGIVTIAAYGNSEGEMVLAVADTGIGMTAEQLPKAMAKFGQIEQPYVKKYEGSGLGLPLTRHMVERHGGRIDIQSTPGIGTIVTVNFPRERTIAATPRK